MSLTSNPEINSVSMHFHMVYDDDFQKVVLDATSLPRNWREVFDFNHHAEDEEFLVPL